MIYHQSGYFCTQVTREGLLEGGVTLHSRKWFLNITSMWLSLNVQKFDLRVLRKFLSVEFLKIAC